MMEAYPPFRVLVVDDEPAARRGVTQLLEAEDELEVVAECRTGDEMVSAVEREQPDLVFLDVQMPGLDGFGALARLEPASTPLVVFVTGYDRYAVRAFEAHAVDYLLKPYSPDRFRESCDRAKRELRHRRLSADDGHRRRLLGLLEELATRADAPAPERDPVRFLVRKARGRIVIVRGHEILWIQAQRDYVALHTADAEHLVRATMYSAERELDGRFVRIHRSTIVRLSSVVEIRAAGDRLQVELTDGSRHDVSAAGRRQLREKLGARV